ncbi:MAG: VTT domain-containing protein, partial [Rhodopseudomonas palustris]|nr:VTT domain-containing protein [Rhodopseudomonas palustris]
RSVTYYYGLTQDTDNFLQHQSRCTRSGVCLFVPGSILTGLGAVIFGLYLGFVYVWLGAMLGAAAAFYIGRTLGREFAASLIGDRLRRYDDAIERNGFATVLYLRLIYFPAPR